MPKGVVGYVGGKEFDDREGGKVTLYSVKLDGDDTWYRFDQTNPADLGVKKGVSVSFTLNKKGKPDPATVTVVGATAPVRSPAPRPSSTSKDTYWSDKESRDIAKDKRYQEVDIPRMTYCGAQDTAVKVVELAIAQGAINLGTKANAKLDIIIAAVDKVAEALFQSRWNVTKPKETSDDNNNSSTAAESDEDANDYGSSEDE